jgi:hypothetical protein
MSERRGGEKGVMSGMFNGLPCCMVNKVGTKKEERLGLITHLSRPVTAIPPQPIRCLISTMGL